MEAAPPLYATEYQGGPHRLDDCRLLAGGMGLSLMPHQELVLTAATEMDADGLPLHREVVLTLPRQSGKTVVVALAVLHRLLLWPVQPQIAGYVSDSVTTSMRLWRDQLVPLMGREGLADKIGLKLYQALGDARITLGETGSTMFMVAGLKASGHGQTLNMVVMDEAFSYQDDRHEQALLPAMQTIRDAQMWVVSTAGDFSSTYLRRKVEAGRRRVEAGVQAGPAYFEWAAPEDCDYTDPAVWARANPALHRTTHESVVRHAFETMDAPEFRRAMLNMWDDHRDGRRHPPGALGPGEQQFRPPHREGVPRGGRPARARPRGGRGRRRPQRRGPPPGPRPGVGGPLPGGPGEGPQVPWGGVCKARPRGPLGGGVRREGALAPRVLVQHRHPGQGRGAVLRRGGQRLGADSAVGIIDRRHARVRAIHAYHQGRGWIWKRRTSAQTQDISPMLAASMAYDLALGEERTPRSTPRISRVGG